MLILIRFKIETPGAMADTQTDASRLKMGARCHYEHRWPNHRPYASILGWDKWLRTI